MFKEFAVDPSAAVRSHRDLVYVLEKFGMHHGRFISQFPVKWKQMAYDAATQKHRGKVELSRIVERLRTVRDGVLIPRGRSGGDAALPWLERAIASNYERPFDAIVGEHDRVDLPFVPFDAFDESHVCLAPNRQWKVLRNARDLAATCAMHLQTAKTVKLIDPHLDLLKGRFRRPFEAMLQIAGPNRPAIDIYRSDAESADECIRRVNTSASNAAAQGFPVRLFLRAEAVMHNRFVLTERGGVMFGTGLDDEDNGNGTATDEVTLLDPPVWQELWEEYSDQVPLRTWTISPK
jgi:hypothetical protein